jgi:hypothetical protein
MISSISLFRFRLSEFFQRAELDAKRDKARVRKGGISVEPEFALEIILCGNMIYV